MRCTDALRMPRRSDASRDCSGGNTAAQAGAPDRDSRRSYPNHRASKALRLPARSLMRGSPRPVACTHPAVCGASAAKRRRRRALPSTNTLDIDIAAAANTGDSSAPKAG